MSEKKSWDVQPKRQPAARPQPTAPTPVQRPSPTVPRPAVTPTPRAQPQIQTRKPQPRQTRVQEQQPPPIRTTTRRAPLRATGELRQERQKRKRVMRYLLLALLVVLIGAAFYVLWLPSLRIQSIQASGPDTDAAKTIAQMKLQGTYAHILPRNSIFFYPKELIRSAILDAQPDVSAVSLQRTSFTSIAVTTTARPVAFEWCGVTIQTPDPDGCTDADIEGFLFKQSDIANPVSTPHVSSATSSTSTSTPVATSQSVLLPTDGPIRVFSPLDRDVSNGQSPIRAHILSYALIPDALKFVDAMRGLGAPVSVLAIRGDEADLWLGGPTRITYVLGHEEDAAVIAGSVLPTLNLKNGSIQYVDLRFPGKAYIKRYGDDSQ